MESCWKKCEMQFQIILTILAVGKEMKEKTQHFVRQQIQSDSGADNLLHIGSNDGNFVHDPQ